MQAKELGKALLKWGGSDRVRIRVMLVFFGLFFIAVFRHVLIEGDHLWTGEAARFSWSMRLKGKICRYSVKASLNDPWSKPDFSKLTEIQVMNLEDPLFLMQFVQQTACKLQKEVYIRAQCRAIGYQPELLVDPDRNLCQVTYRTWVHNDWIKPSPGNWDSDYSLWFAGTWGRGIR